MRCLRELSHTRRLINFTSFESQLFQALPSSQHHLATGIMAWTQDDLQSLEQLLESKLKDEKPSSTKMHQSQGKQHPTKQEELQQGRSGNREPGLINPPHDTTRSNPTETSKWVCTLLVYILGFCVMYQFPKKESTTPSLPEQQPAFITEFHIRVDQPGNYTVSVPKMWSMASTSVVTETVTTTATEEITVTATVTEVRIPPSVTDYHVHVNQGCMSTMIDNRLWSGCPEKDENVEGLIRRLMDEGREVSG